MHGAGHYLKVRTALEKTSSRIAEDWQRQQPINALDEKTKADRQKAFRMSCFIDTQETIQDISKLQADAWFAQQVVTSLEEQKEAMKDEDEVLYGTAYMAKLQLRDLKAQHAPEQIIWRANVNLAMAANKHRFVRNSWVHRDVNKRWKQLRALREWLKKSVKKYTRLQGWLYDEELVL